jgi:hypothetical protein
MLPLIEQKFKHVYGSNMIHIDPVTNPVGINPLDLDLQGLDETSRNRTLNQLAQLFTNLFKGKSNELSDRMDVLFTRVLKLMLFGLAKTQKRTPTIKDFESFFNSPKPWDEYAKEIRLLPEEERPFFSKFNYKEYTDTRRQINRRLHSVLGDPFLAKMLTAERNEFRFEDYIDHGGVVLINTNLATLLEDNSAFFGGVFIVLLQLAMMRRKPDASYPCFVMYDEAAEYFSSATIIKRFINQGRKRRFASMFAHQTLSQATGDLKDALESVGTQLACNVIPADMGSLCGVFRTTREFLEAQQTEPVTPPALPQWADYAFIYRGRRKPYSVRVHYGVLEHLDTSGMASRKSRSAPPPPDEPSRPGTSADMLWEVTLHPAKAKKGGLHRLKLPDGTVVDILIKPGTRYGSSYRLKGKAPNGADLYIVWTKHPDIVDEANDNDDDDMDLRAAPHA